MTPDALDRFRKSLSSVGSEKAQRDMTKKMLVSSVCGWLAVSGCRVCGFVQSAGDVFPAEQRYLHGACKRTSLLDGVQSRGAKLNGSVLGQAHCLA
jgi:hypothetical protein